MAVEIIYQAVGPYEPLADIIRTIRAPAYCDCVFPRSTEMLGFKGNIHERITCRCGEDEGHGSEWIWDKDSADPECYISGSNITFHPTYSQGTAVVRGERRLEPGMIHFWEVKIITPLSGTETMIGIGTDKVDLLANRFRFTSVLGMDDQSWGYSFRGKTQYNGHSRHYGKTFSQGCIVGVYLDLSRGHLEFFLNRRPLGIAYRNIPIDPSIKLYPMACSTAANSSIRLLDSTSCHDSLQFRTMQTITRRRPDYLAKLKEMPGLKYLLENYWFLIPSDRYSNESSYRLSLEDEAVVQSHKAKKLKIDDDVDIDTLYRDADKIQHRVYSDSEEDEFDVDTRDFCYCFCDH